MKRLRFGLLRVSVSRLVLLLVGFSCAHVWASTEIDVTSVTNRTFTDYDEMVSFCDDQVYSIDWLTNRIAEIDGDLDDDHQSIANIIASVDTALYSMEVDGLQGTAAYNALDSARDQLMDFEDRHDEFSNTIEDTRTVLLDVRRDINYYARTAPTYQIVVDGYEAPDYGIVLASIRVNLTHLVNLIDLWNSDWYDFTYAFYDFYTSFAESMISGLGGNPSWSDESQLAAKLATLLARNFSNEWDAVYYLNLYSQTADGIFNDWPVQIGPPYLQEMWNYILKPFAMTWADADLTDNRMINAFRQFYLSSETNRLDSGADFIVTVTNTSYNPVWVSLTNAVRIDNAIDINWDQLFDKMDSMNDLVWTVSVTNIEDFVSALLDEEERRTEQEISDLESEQGPDEETTSMPVTSLSVFSSVGSHLREICTSYGNMFNHIPSTEPQSIMLWQGGNYGDLEIHSLHWSPPDLSGVRKLFSFGWYCVYVVVVLYSIAIDVFVACVLYYMVYGLLLGKSEVAYKGLQMSFEMLCGFFGYKRK